MAIARMDNVLLVVDDLEAVKAFFIELGLVLEGESTVQGPLVGKLIAWGPTREEAVARMRRALSETFIVGIDTTIPFYSYVLAQPEYANGTLDTALIGEFVSRMGTDLKAGAEPVLANAGP